MRLLFKRRFHQVWLRQEYHPKKDAKTIYYLNHHSWWDGLIPLLLNEFCFHQEARAMMEDKQMRKYSFFKKIGAFSINRNDSRSAVTSLRYAVESFERDHSCLFIYPEGTITPAGSQMDFEGGLGWLANQLPEVDVVPIGIYMHTIRHEKPELHLQVGPAVDVDQSLSKNEKTALFEHKLDDVLNKLRQKAGFDDSHYKRFP